MDNIMQQDVAEKRLINGRYQLDECLFANNSGSLYLASDNEPGGSSAASVHVLVHLLPNRSIGYAELPELFASLQQRNESFSPSISVLKPIEYGWLGVAAYFVMEAPDSSPVNALSAAASERYQQAIDTTRALLKQGVLNNSLIPQMFLITQREIYLLPTALLEPVQQLSKQNERLLVEGQKARGRSVRWLPLLGWGAMTGVIAGGVYSYYLAQQDDSAEPATVTATTENTTNGQEFSPSDAESPTIPTTIAATAEKPAFPMATQEVLAAANASADVRMDEAEAFPIEAAIEAAIDDDVVEVTSVDGRQRVTSSPNIELAEVTVVPKTMPQQEPIVRHSELTQPEPVKIEPVPVTPSIAELQAQRKLPITTIMPAPVQVAAKEAAAKEAAAKEAAAKEAAAKEAAAKEAAAKEAAAKEAAAKEAAAKEAAAKEAAAKEAAAKEAAAKEAAAKEAAAKEAAAKEAAAKEAAAKEAAAKEAAAKEAAAKEAAAKEAAAKEAAAKEAAAKEAAAKEAAAKEAAAKEAAAKEAAAKEAAAKEAAAKEAAAKEAAAKEAAAKEAAAKEAAAKEAAAKEAAAKEAAAKEAAAKEAAAKEAAAKEAAAKEAAAKEAAAKEAAAKEAAAKEAAAKEVTAKEAAAKEVTAKEAAAKEVTAKEAAAKEAAAKEAAAKEAAAKEAAAKEAAAKEAAAKEVAAKEAAAKEAAAKEAAAKEAAAKEAAAKEAAAKEAAAKEAAAKEAAAKEAAAKEAAAKEAAAKEAAAKEAAAKEAAAKEAAAKEAAAKEAAAKEAAAKEAAAKEAASKKEKAEQDLADKANQETEKPDAKKEDTKSVRKKKTEPTVAGLTKDEVVQKAYKAIAEDKLSEAAGKGAVYYIRLLKRIDRTNPQVQRLARKVVSAYHVKTRLAIKRKHQLSAQRLLWVAGRIIKEFNLTQMNKAHAVLKHRIEDEFLK